jgi:hypothetical protein
MPNLAERQALNFLNPKTFYAKGPGAPPKEPAPDAAPKASPEASKETS